MEEGDWASVVSQKIGVLGGAVHFLEPGVTKLNLDSQIVGSATLHLSWFPYMYFSFSGGVMGALVAADWLPLLAPWP